jgi:hypothetical protein
MATIRLGRYEARQGNLPSVCIRCGIAASVYQKKVFDYSPWWFYLGIPIGLFPYLILNWFWSKRARVRVPLCPLHRGLWRWQQPALIFASSLVGIGLGLFPLVMALDGKYATEKADKIVILAILGILAAAYLYPVATIVLKYLGIHATEVSANSVTLTGVAAEFLEALRVAHEMELPRQQGARETQP